VDLVYVARVDVGAQIRDMFIDVVGRVRGARRYAVTLAVKLLSDASVLNGANEPGSCVEVLWAAAWIAGEYCRQAPLDMCSELH
jgi:AP-3 complex subunit delta-1